MPVKVYYANRSQPAFYVYIFANSAPGKHHDDKYMHHLRKHGSSFATIMWLTQPTTVSF